MKIWLYNVSSILNGSQEKQILSFQNSEFQFWNLIKDCENIDFVVSLCSGSTTAESLNSIQSIIVFFFYVVDDEMASCWMRWVDWRKTEIKGW